jgi:hypothetical protein
MGRLSWSKPKDQAVVSRQLLFQIICYTINIMGDIDISQKDPYFMDGWFMGVKEYLSLKKVD